MKLYILALTLLAIATAQDNNHTNDVDLNVSDYIGNEKELPINATEEFYY